MLIYSQNGVHIEQVDQRQFIISADGYGQILLINLPIDNLFMMDTKFLEVMARGVAIRTGKVSSKKAK